MLSKITRVGKKKRILVEVRKIKKDRPIGNMLDLEDWILFGDSNWILVILIYQLHGCVEVLEETKVVEDSRISFLI